MKICKIGIMFVCIYITIKIKFMYNRTQLNMNMLMFDGEFILSKLVSV